MTLKEAPESSDDASSFSANEPTSFVGAGEAGASERGLKIVTLAPSSLSQPDLEGGNALEAASPSDPYVGCTIDGRYKVEARLGEGGMGVVYRCSHKVIGKKVAMKVLRADLARDIEATERFLNEAKAASSIGNPHIIDISDFGQFADGATYFVMEYLDGQPLSAVLRSSGAQPLPRLISIAAQLAEGLFAAHTAHIVHRDLKPDNIFLVTRGQNKDFVKILDFGIAKVSNAEGRLTRAGAVFGTPHYMSPEQAAGSTVDHRGDIYSFGVILYELASGRVPFDADNFMGILTQHIYKQPLPLRALVPPPEGVPPGLEAIILKCLSKRPDQRFQSMQELLDDLRKLEAGAVPDAVPDMLKRSGSFDVPHDYFNASRPKVLSAPDARSFVGSPRRWAALLGIAAVVVGIALLASRTPNAPGEPLVETAPEPKGAHAQEVPPAHEAAAHPVQVVLAIEPLDAHVFRGDTNLGASPVIVPVNPHESVTLEIKRDGYASQSVVLDGTESKRSIKLARTKKKAPTPGSSAARAGVKPPPSPRQNIGGSEIINPWSETTR
ncbi:MAG TPA: serine/threonine-protein kinase [Polyangiaceae bacterium]